MTRGHKSKPSSSLKGKGDKRDRSSNQSLNRSDRLNDTKRLKNDESTSESGTTSNHEDDPITPEMEEELLREDVDKETTSVDTPPEERTNYFSYSPNEGFQGARGAPSAFMNQSSISPTSNTSSSGTVKSRVFTSSPVSAINSELSIQLDYDEKKEAARPLSFSAKEKEEIEGIANKFGNVSMCSPMAPGIEATPELDASLPPLTEAGIGLRTMTSYRQVDRKPTPMHAGSYGEWRTAHKRTNTKSSEERTRFRPYQAHSFVNLQANSIKFFDEGNIYATEVRSFNKRKLLLDVMATNSNGVASANKITVYFAGYPHRDSIVNDSMRDTLIEALHKATLAFEEASRRRGIEVIIPMYPSVYPKHGTLEIGGDTPEAARFALRTFNNRLHNVAGANRTTLAIPTLEMDFVPTFIINAPGDTTWDSLKLVCGTRLRFGRVDNWIKIHEVKITKNQKTTARFAVAMPDGQEFRATLMNLPGIPEIKYYPTARRDVWSFKYQMTETEIGKSLHIFVVALHFNSFSFLSYFQLLATLQQPRQASESQPTTFFNKKLSILSTRTLMVTSKTWASPWKPLGLTSTSRRETMRSRTWNRSTQPSQLPSNGANELLLNKGNLLNASTFTTFVEKNYFRDLPPLDYADLTTDLIELFLQIKAEIKGRIELQKPESLLASLLTRFLDVNYTLAFQTIVNNFCSSKSLISQHPADHRRQNKTRATNIDYG